MRHFPARTGGPHVCDSQLAAGSYATPKVPALPRPYRNEENSEHAYCGIEASCGNLRESKSPSSKLRVAKTSLRCFRLRQFQKAPERHQLLLPFLEVRRIQRLKAGEAPAPQASVKYSRSILYMRGAQLFCVRNSPKSRVGIGRRNQPLR